MNLTVLRPDYKLHLAMSPEQGFYSAPASIVVTPQQKLDALSLHEIHAAVLLGDSARPDP